MQWWMAGIALAGLVALAAWDVGRAGRASASALLALRAIGGLGLTAMAALSLSFGAREAAAVAAVAAAPLLLGLMRAPRRVEGEMPVAVPARPASESPAPAAVTAASEERRAA